MAQSDIPTVRTETSASTGALVRRLLAFTWRYRWGCIRVLAIQVVLLTLGLLGLGLMGHGVDYIKFEMGLRGGLSNAKPPQWPFGVTPPADWSHMHTLGAVAVAILLFALLRAVLNFFYNIWLAKLVHADIVVDLRRMVYDKMQRLSFRFFDGNASSSIINRVTGDVQSVRSFVDSVMVNGVILVLSLIVYLVYMLSIHVWLTVACLAGTPLLWALTTYFSRVVQPAYRKNRELFDRMLQVLSENISGAYVVKGFAREQDEITKFDKVNDEVATHKMWVISKVSTFSPLIGFLTHVNLAILLGYGGWLAIRYEQAPDAATAVTVGLSVGNLLVFTGLLQQFSGQVANIANIANVMQQSLTGAQRVFEVLDAPVEISSAVGAIRLEKPTGALRFENLGFSYADASVEHVSDHDLVLRNFNLDVKPGECIAILGGTGAGKSTLFSLICRFYDPTKGRITLDGHDLRELEIDDIRRSIGVVFQENFLFSTSVAANIAFGHPNATRAQVEAAAKVAAAHNFIMKLPQGYDTILHEGGSNLSGGQRQRLAIARAILLEPAILLLDDPTAAVDSHTEGEILTAMEQAMQGRTTFIVAHRMSALRRSDRVVVLDNGRIIQVGSHADLLAQPGYYQRIAQLQLDGNSGDVDDDPELTFDTSGPPKPLEDDDL